MSSCSQNKYSPFLFFVYKAALIHFCRQVDIVMYILEIFSLFGVRLCVLVSHSFNNTLYIVMYVKKEI